MITDITVKDGFVLVRREIDGKVYRDGALPPGADLTGKEPEIVDVAAAAWTPEVIAAYQAVNPPIIPSAEKIKASFINAVQGHIDTVAMSRGYDSGVSLASYATDTHPPFAAEANAFIPWRSSVWLYCYQEWAKVEAGQRQVTTAAAFINELPVIVWP